MRLTTASRFASLALLFATALTTTLASAKPHHGHADGKMEEPDEDDRDASTKPAAAAEDAETADDDGGAPVVNRTPAQTERRDRLVVRERDLVRQWVHRDGKRISPRERQAIGLHWRHVMRLSRIREFAEQDHDTALLSRIDALLDRADKTFTARMNAPSSDGGAR